MRATLFVATERDRKAASGNSHAQLATNSEDGAIVGVRTLPRHPLESHTVTARFSLILNIMFPLLRVSSDRT
jgi:hypothetical protein